MSFFLQDIKFYPNWINYNTSAIDGINYNPDNEPSVATADDYTNSDGTQTGPAYDLLDNKLGSVVTFGTTGNPGITVQFDFTSAINFDTIILANHNLGTCTCDIEFDLAASATVTFSTVNSSTLNLRFPKGYYVLDNAVSVASNKAAFISGEIGVALFELDGETSESLLQMDISSPSYSDDPTIGEFIASNKWTTPHAPETQGWVFVDQYGNIINRAQGGQNYSTFNYGLKKRITLAWQHLSNSELDELEQVFQVTKGATYPFFVDLGEHATQHFLRYMRLAAPFSAVPIAGGTAWNVTLTLEEE